MLLPYMSPSLCLRSGPAAEGLAGARPYVLLLGTDRSMKEARNRFIKELEGDKNNFLEEEQFEIRAEG